MAARLDEYPSILSKLSKDFKLPQADILNVYVVGSRLWGTMHKGSDWDLVVIVKSWQSKPSDVHNGIVDAHILSQDQYMQALISHNFRSIVCLFTPQHLRLKESIKFHDEFKLNKSLLKQSIFDEHERDIRIASKHAIKGKVDIAKKICLHTLRELALGEQLCRLGRIQDFHINREIFDELSYQYATDWETLYSLFLPYFDQFKAEISNLCAAI